LIIDSIVNICVPGLFILIGGVIMFFAIRKSFVRQSWPTGTGTVRGYRIEERSDSEGTAYKAMVDFEYDAGGRIVQGTGSLGSESWAGPRVFATNAISKAQKTMPVGGPIALIIDPNNPDNARPATGRRLDTGNMILAVVFVASGVIWMGIALPGAVTSLVNAIRALIQR
jgi:hypothetical protein